VQQIRGVVFAGAVSISFSSAKHNLGALQIFLTSPNFYRNPQVVLYTIYFLILIEIFSANE